MSRHRNESAPGRRQPGKTAAFLVLAALALPCSIPRAATVFRCEDKGRTIFSETATGPACRSLDVDTYPPEPADVERQQQELQEWNRERAAEVRRSLNRESAAEAQRRQDELKALGTEQPPAGNKGHHGRRSKRRGGGRHSHPEAPPAGPAAAATTGTVGAPPAPR